MESGRGEAAELNEGEAEEMAAGEHRRSGSRSRRITSCKEHKQRALWREGPDEYMIACWQEVITVLTRDMERLEARLEGDQAMGTGRPVPTLSTLERLFDEVDEFHLRFKKLRIQQKTTEIGSADYLDQLSDIYTELKTLELKAKHAAQGVEDFQESLPEDEPEPETPKKPVHGRRTARRR
jgi:hypothetical protein